MELFGATLQHELSKDFKSWLAQEVKLFWTDFSSQVRKDSNKLLLDGLTTTEKKIMLLEGRFEDVKITQDQCLDEMIRFQEDIDRKVYRNKEEFDKKLERIAKELDKHLFSDVKETPSKYSGKVSEEMLTRVR